jgi:hypothetical protein
MPTLSQPPWLRKAGDKEDCNYPGRSYCSKKKRGLKEQGQPKLGLAMDSAWRCLVARKKGTGEGYVSSGSGRLFICQEEAIEN